MYNKKATKERLEAIAAQNTMPRVRVVPTDEKYRTLRHPNGVHFRSTGSIEWPLDKFTARRLREGSIKIEEKKEQGGEGRRSRSQPES